MHECITTMALVVSRYRSVNPPRGDLVLSVVSIHGSLNIDILGVKFDSTNLYILGVKFDSNLPSKTMCVVLFLVSQRIGILRLVKHVFVDTSVLLCCYYAFVLPILEYSALWGSAGECYLQLL